MSNIGLIDPIYCYKMSSFISDIKKEKENYLEKSIITNVDVITYGLLRIIFLIQSFMCFESHRFFNEFHIFFGILYRR